VEPKLEVRNLLTSVRVNGIDLDIHITFPKPIPIEDLPTVCYATKIEENVVLEICETKWAT
jgi:hypothetical protein